MVKRQTVWLSTMMVLSLMLIGYYTMNNQSGTATTTQPNSDSVATSVTQPSTSGGASATNSTSSTSSTGATATTDWYTNQQTNVSQQLSEQIDRQKAVLANNNASSDQIASAESQLAELQDLTGGIDNATQMIKADGFKNAVIVPDAKLQTFSVYVQASNLQKDDVIKVMNIVSQQLDVSMLNVTVKAHA
ncbi:SpoIIIAH-like family protein [Alicyclobacillus fastidiosus]|uniref:SpoIIIAH-like family protein n=1 Tax=Alicyclobacillus fastidiosus TaxID=392011 RepID=A0ABV5AFU2_9BACL|nr:SpoIIIAH-like family protein [Alicyclobacillus fastidiosus]WEH11714.1 SpoIIIAH-like family protein [Alicyclobacillus fastidiosus]